MPSPKTHEERAEECCKEAYFDLTTHPSEAGPKGAALLDEYLQNVEKRVAQALRDTESSIAAEVMGVLPEYRITPLQKKYDQVGKSAWNKARASVKALFEKKGITT